MEYRKIIFDELTPIAIYIKLKEFFKDELVFLFESAINTENGNQSFIFAGVREKISFKDGVCEYTNGDNIKTIIDQNPFEFLKKYYSELDKEFYQKKATELDIGFVDGFVGYIGYDTVKVFEPILKKRMDNLQDELKIGDFELIRPKLVCAYSHKTNKLTLLSSFKKVADELLEIENLLTQPYQSTKIQKSNIDQTKGKFAFSKEQFFEMVDKSKEMIKSGDVFQILMSNRFTQYATIDKLSFYRVLRSKNPSPYMFLLDFDKFAIIGSSPEVMVALKNGEITLRPIAGTRKRGLTAQRDKELENELLGDEKERAEHLMLIDLGRNDVGRVAQTASVKVTEIMRVERYSHVMHLVSDVEAKLKEDKDMFDLFAATFTAGTMTGAPKIRAMELIAEFEGLKRGYYSGAVGYFGFDGNMDSAIAIRTSYLDDEKIVFQAGAGVVADSKNELEYLEVQNKLAALMSTLNDLKL